MVRQQNGGKLNVAHTGKIAMPKKQAIIVSREKGETREHRAINPKKKFDLRHNRLDGEIFQQTTCCNYLLVNDSTKKAYFIELKGDKIDYAVEQLEKGAQMCRKELQEYSFFYRIVCSKARTHKIQGNKFRKFKENHGKHFVMKENSLEEVLD